MRDQKVARIGVQEYSTADGQIQRELRLPEDVFDIAALTSGEGQPIADLHPADGRVTSVNYRGLSCGVMSMCRPDDTMTFVVADILVQDESLIRKIESGEQVELSLGYDTIAIPIEGGVWRQAGHDFDGVEADVRQTSIRVNHLAVVPDARANQGLPDKPVRVRLDANGNQSTEDARRFDQTPKSKPQAKGKKMKFNLPNGDSVEIDDSVGAALSAQRADVNGLTKVVAEMGEAVKAMSARLEAMKAKEETTADEEPDPKKKDQDGKREKEDEEEEDEPRQDSAADVEERYRLMRDAEDAGIKPIKAACLSSRAIRLAVLKHRGVTVPASRADSDDYIAAVYDLSTDKASSGPNESEVVLFPPAGGRTDGIDSPYVDAFKKRYG